MLEFMLVTNAVTIFTLGWLFVAYRKRCERLSSSEEKNAEYEKTLFLQSRHAAVSEMLSSIIHQWREPLGAVGAIQSGITARVMFGQAIENEFLLESAQSSTNILRHLSETIETFYGFIKNKNEPESTFSIKSTLEMIKKIMSYSLERNGVTLTYNIDGDYILTGCENEFSQVLINIISNDRDILTQMATKEHRTINIDISGLENRCIITVKDNAGGITLTPIEKIFEPSVSSKGGSGIGLYISKNIIEDKFNGSLSVANDENGAVFKIEVPCSDKTAEISNVFGDEINGKTKMISQIIELENAEKDMRKWAEIFSKAHWGIAVSKGRSNYIEMVNPAFAAMHGYTQEEIHNIPSTDFFSPDHLYDCAQKIEQAHEEGFVSFSSVRMRKDGSLFPAHIDLTAVKDANGAVLYRIANIKDISEEQQQKSMLEIISFAINHIGDAIHLTDADGKIRWVNAQACDVLGYTEGELVNMSVFDISPDWTEDKSSKYLDALNALQKITVLTTQRRKDGFIFPVEITASIFDYNDEKYTLAIIRDMTKQIKMEHELQQTAMKLMHFASTIPGALYIYHVDADKNGVISYASDKLYDLLGINTNNNSVAKEIIASHCIPTCHGSEFSVEHHEKGERVLKGFSMPQHQNDGSILWYGVLFDITENKNTLNIN